MKYPEIFKIIKNKFKNDENLKVTEKHDRIIISVKQEKNIWTKQQQNYLDKRFEEVDKRFEQVEARLDRVEARLDRVEARLDRVEARLDSLEVKVDKIISLLERHISEHHK